MSSYGNNGETARKIADSIRGRLSGDSGASPQPSSIDAAFARKGPGQGGEVSIKDKAQFDALLKTGKYAIISAGRNMESAADRAMTDDQIAERHNKLTATLKEKGYKYTPMQGQYGGLKEDSIIVMVHDADRKEMFNLGKSLNQDSIIFSERGQQQMVHTTGPNVGMGYEGKGFVNITNATDNFSKVKLENGETIQFSLNFDFDKLKKIDINKPIVKETNVSGTFGHHPGVSKGGGDGGSGRQQRPESDSRAVAPKQSSASSAAKKFVSKHGGDLPSQRHDDIRSASPQATNSASTERKTPAPRDK